MKVVDMFGCGLPVCAIEFKCINELVQHQHNGLLFKTPETLASQIKSLVSGFPEASLTLKKLRENLISFQSLRWDHYWKMHVRPLLH
jgi:beta-1,4-mannosyltransferase